MQRAFTRLGYVLGGALGLSAILNAIINAQQLIRDVSSALVLSAVGLVIWALLEIATRWGAIRWRTPETTTVIRGLGWRVRFAIVGGLGLIWIAQALRIKPATEIKVLPPEVPKIAAPPVTGCAATCSGWCDGEKCVVPETLADAQLGAQGLALNDGQLFWATKGIPDWPIIQAISVAGGAARTWPSDQDGRRSSLLWELR